MTLTQCSSFQAILRLVLRWWKLSCNFSTNWVTVRVLQPPSSRPLRSRFSSIDNGKNTCMTLRNFCHPSMTNDTFSDTFFHSSIFISFDEWHRRGCEAVVDVNISIEFILGFLSSSKWPKIKILWNRRLWKACPPSVSNQKGLIAYLSSKLKIVK